MVQVTTGHIGFLIIFTILFILRVDIELDAKFFFLYTSIYKGAIMRLSIKKTSQIKVEDGDPSKIKA